MQNRNQIEQVAAALASAERALFVTGAGISADSGLPTYRGIGGLYESAGTDEGVPIEEALSGRMMAINPALCWKYIHQIEQACRGARPNRGHEVIAALQDRLEVCVLTQNVDGLHRSAGSRRVIDIHGDIHDLVCTLCGLGQSVADYREIDIPPQCPSCAALVRPRVVLFGEMLDSSKLAALQRELNAGFDIVFSIGTTAVFPYIAQPVLLARYQSITTVEINPGESQISPFVGHKISHGAAATLGAIWEALGQ